ncbi:MAG: DUF4232 domain-containing protein [Acidimicrobiales bacterium]
MNSPLRTLVAGTLCAMALITAGCSSSPRTSSRSSPRYPGAEAGAYCKNLQAGLRSQGNVTQISSPQAQTFFSRLDHDFAKAVSEAPASLRSATQTLADTYRHLGQEVASHGYKRSYNDNLQPAVAGFLNEATPWLKAHCRGYGGASMTTRASITPPAPTTTSPQQAPDLFVSTGATAPPGALYSWPQFPASIHLDDNDWIAGITWTASPTGASGTGTSYTDLSCAGPAASCPPTAEGTVKLSATQPETCTVHFADQSTDAQRSEQALVFDHLQYTLTSGPSAGRVYTFSAPCALGAPQSPGRCHASALSAQTFALASGGAAGSFGGAFSLTNRGTVSCTLLGYPGMQLLGAGGRPLPTTVIRGHYEVVDSVTEQMVTLPPGGEARFYFMYSDALGGGSPAVCPRTSAVEITPPNSYHYIVASADIAPCEGRVWVSPVTASTPFPLTKGSP